MKWIEATMEQALMFAQGKTLIQGHGTAWRQWRKKTLLPDALADAVPFTDGTAVACLSKWNGPYSLDTPDIDADHPMWWIYTSTNEETA